MIKCYQNYEMKQGFNRYAIVYMQRMLEMSSSPDTWGISLKSLENWWPYLRS